MKRLWTNKLGFRGFSRLPSPSSFGIATQARRALHPPSGTRAVVRDPLPMIPRRGRSGATAQVGRISNWGEADAALVELGRLDSELAGIARREREEIVQVQRAALRERRAPERRRLALAAALRRFCRRQWRAPQREGHLSGVQGGRSRRLLFGRVGYRVSHAVRLRSEAAALRSLAATPAGRRYLRVQMGIDRERLRSFLLRQTRTGNGTSRKRKASAGAKETLRRLGRAGVRLEQRENWFYELDRKALHYRG